MKKDIFDNNSNPFTVPDGYFDTLHERIMNRIKVEESKSSHINHYFRRMVAVAACVALICTAVTVYIMYDGKQPFVAETTVDEDFYQLLYTSDRTALLVESLNISMPVNFATYSTEEDEAIMRFLERDNINLIAFIQSINNETFTLP